MGLRQIWCWGEWQQHVKRQLGVCCKCSWWALPFPGDLEWSKPFLVLSVAIYQNWTLQARFAGLHRALFTYLFQKEVKYTCIALNLAHVLPLGRCSWKHWLCQVLQVVFRIRPLNLIVPIKQTNTKLCSLIQLCRNESLIPGFALCWEASHLSSYHGSLSSPSLDAEMLCDSALLPAAQHHAEGGRSPR